MISKLFGKLYWRWFGRGEAYSSPLNYAIADVVKALSGNCWRKEG